MTPGDKKSTSTLLSDLCRTGSLMPFLKNNETSMEAIPFHVYLMERCREAGEPAEHVIRRAGIERTYGHQIFRGVRKPSRDKVIQLALGFGFGPEETQKLLRAAQMGPLYPRIKRDAAILFCLNRNKSIVETQYLLHELGLHLLGSDRNDES